MPNSIFAELLTGSVLYGTWTKDSDIDIFRLVYPTVEELVANRNVTIAQIINEHEDIRTVMLGEFVMSLGSNIERTLTAMHYPEYFGELRGYWECWEFADKLLAAAKKMIETAQNNKQKAHAYRLWMAYIYIVNREVEYLYPMPKGDREIYHAIRRGEADVNVDWNPTINMRGVRDGKINREALADWVWAKYQQEVI